MMGKEERDPEMLGSAQRCENESEAKDKYEGQYDNLPSFKIPSWIVSSGLVIILSAIFIKSLFSPIEPFWGLIGSLRYAIILGGVLYAFLSLLFIISATSEKGMIARVGIVGGGIVGIMFGFLGWISVFLAAATALLIYMLSILILEEEDEVSGDDSSV